MKISNAILRFSLTTVLVCLLSACDGGIFGTGDGRPVIVDNLDATESVGDIAGAPDSGDLAEPTQLSFENLQIGTTTTTPLINIINVSDQAINARLNNSSSEVFDTPIDAGAFSETVPLVLGENSLLLIQADTSDEPISIQPLTVGTLTLTTLIVRNTATQELDLVPLSSLSISPTPSMAQLRVIQANVLSDSDMPASFALQPAGNSPGATEVMFTDVSVASAAAASYQLVSTGDYLLVDSLNRLDPQLLTMRAGKIYTLIILNTADAAYLLHEDDLLAQ